MVLRVLSAAFLGIILTSQALAFDFTHANQLFEARGNGQGAIAEARAAYTQALGQTSGDELIFAVESLSRLDYLESRILPDSSNDARKTILERCLSNLDKISPDKVGKTPVYYYWKATCLARWSEANGILTSLFKTGELFGYLNDGLTTDPRYEGGGFDRILCSVYVKLPAFNPFGPSRNLGKAESSCEKAMGSAAYPGAKHPETATGDYFYSINEFYAELYNAKGDNAKAVQMLDDGIQRINGGDIAPDRVPETAIEKQNLVDTKTRLGGRH